MCADVGRRAHACACLRASAPGVRVGHWLSQCLYEFECGCVWGGGGGGVGVYVWVGGCVCVSAQVCEGVSACASVC